MKLYHQQFLVFITLTSYFFHVESLCLGLLCSCVPWVSKTCCGTFSKCCVQYQAWLSPLITEDVIGEYVEAFANEAINGALPEIVDFLGLPDRLVVPSTGAVVPIPEPSTVPVGPIGSIGPVGPVLPAASSASAEQIPALVSVQTGSGDNRPLSFLRPLSMLFEDRRRKRNCPNCWQDRSG